MATLTGITPISITKTKFKTLAKFPGLNKQNNWEDYTKQLNETPTEKVEINEIITLSDNSFNYFKTALLDSHDWLDGKGGADSEYKIEFTNFWELTATQQQEWRERSYLTVILVQNTKGDNILVDPQGYNYARYCGQIA
tara:strand:- start:20231 stop:20647 length:417 start_codon:yes stop_codon:yes gene_type:complete